MKRYKEIILYMLFGIATTIISWGTYSLFVFLIKNINIANVLSWICAVLFAFVTNKKIVFKDSGKILQELLKFFLSRLFTGILEILGVPLLIYIGFDWTLFGIEGLAAKIIISLAVTLINYFFSRFLIFKDKNNFTDIRK